MHEDMNTMMFIGWERVRKKSMEKKIRDPAGIWTQDLLNTSQSVDLFLTLSQPININHECLLSPTVNNIQPIWIPSLFTVQVTLSCSHWLLEGSSCFYEQMRHQDTYSQHRCSSRSLLLPHSHINPVGKRQIAMITTCPVSAWHNLNLFSCFAPQYCYSLGCNNDLDHIHMAFLSHWSSANQIEALFCIRRPGHHIGKCP